MSYNWTSASTPQGRERLKQLLDQGHRVVGKVGEFGRITAFWRQKESHYDVDGYIPIDMFQHASFGGIEFLDPQPEPVADENGLLPCPFCGGKAIVAEHDLLYTRFIANCESCEAESSVFVKRSDAIAAWNRREGKETNP